MDQAGFEHRSLGLKDLLDAMRLTECDWCGMELGDAGIFNVRGQLIVATDCKFVTSTIRLPNS